MQRLINERLSQAANQQQRQRVIIRQQEHNNVCLFIINIIYL